MSQLILLMATIKRDLVSILALLAAAVVVVVVLPATTHHHHHHHQWQLSGSLNGSHRSLGSLFPFSDTVGESSNKWTAALTTCCWASQQLASSISVVADD